MRFVNNTPLQAAMVPSSEEDDRVTALFLCAITYRIEDGRLLLAPTQRPLMLRHEQPYPNDAMLVKAAVSVCATGYVYPARPGALAAEARLDVGAARAAIAAFGPRRWQKALLSSALSPSAPVPFDRVPMTWESAFGGVAEEPAAVLQVDGQDAFLPAHENGYPFNFDGVGFYADAKQAEGQPLPQLEHPAQLVESWDDRPEPVCFAPYPSWGGLRANHVMVDGQFDPSRINKIPSRAAPRTTFDRLDAGTPISLLGMRPDGAALSFVAPASPVSVELTVGGAPERALLLLDAVDIDAEAAEVRLLYRAQVTYGLVQFDLRSASLEPTLDFPES